MKFQKGQGGRPKGVRNKSTKAVKEALTLAFQGMGGVESLTKWGKANPELFYQLWVRMLVVEAKIDFNVSSISKLSDEELEQKRRQLKLVS